MSVEEAFAKFGIVDPLKELAESKELEGVAGIVDLFKTISPDLVKYMAFIALISYQEGLSHGRFEAIENPGQALQAEYKALRKSGVTDAAISEGIQQALAAKRQQAR